MPLRSRWELHGAEGGERAGRLALGTGDYLCYIVIRYIGEFSAAFLYRNPQKPRKKKNSKESDAFNEIL